jgi:hypothetical protein
MGYGPGEIRSMWLWEFMTLVDEAVSAASKGKRMTDDEVEEIGDWVDSLPDQVS